MTDKPDKYINWATSERLDPVFNTENVVEPPEAIKQYGFSPCEQVPNSWVNWLFFYIDWWIKYFDENVTVHLNKPLAYTVATVPDATENPGLMIYVTDETDGATIAFSNGTNWLRITDGQIISD